jgi:hypothetical protein
MIMISVLANDAMPVGRDAARADTEVSINWNVSF